MYTNTHIQALALYCYSAYLNISLLKLYWLLLLLYYTVIMVIYSNKDVSVIKLYRLFLLLDIINCGYYLLNALF